MTAELEPAEQDRAQRELEEQARVQREPVEQARVQRPTPGPPDGRLPGLGQARAAMLEIHRALGAAHTAVFVHDAGGGVLHLVDQAIPAPPLDDFWSRIFMDENVPPTEAVHTGRPTDGGFTEIDATLRRYAGFSGAAPGLGRVVCFPLVAAGGRTAGALFTDGCRSAEEIGDVTELEQRLAPQLGALAAELEASTEPLLTRIAERAYGLRKAGAERAEQAGRAGRAEQADQGGQAEQAESSGCTESSDSTPCPGSTASTASPEFAESPESPESAELPDRPDQPSPTAVRAAISCGTFWWDLRRSEIHLDPVAMGALGGDGQGYTGSPVPLLARIHRDDYPLVRRTMARALAEQGVFALEYRAHTRGGSLHWIEARGRVVRDERGEPVMLGILTDTTGSPSWTQLASTQIDAMPDGFAVLDPRRRLVYANDAVARLVGLGRAELVGRRFEDLLAPLDPADWGERLDQVVRTGVAARFELLLPHIGRWFELRAMLDAGRVAVHLRDVHDERVRLERDRERDARRERAGAFAAELGGTLGVDDVIAVFEQQMSALCEADGVAMHVATGGRLRLIAAVGYSAAGLGGLRVLDLDAPGPMSDAVNECDVQVYEDGEDIKRRYPFLAEMCEETDTGALLVFPLVYDDACLGLVCLRFDRPHRIGEGYLGFVGRRCDQLAQALYRAHRYDAELSLASRLRDAVFDVPLDLMPGLELASEYRSPGLGLAVGGDWYDAIPMARGRIGLLVGDVEGHNARAVGGMSMVRTAIRAFAHEGYGPAAILGRVNKLIAGLDPDLLATCCVAELDPASGTARIARAGHPSPVLSLADGGAGLLELPAGLPLGVDPAETYRSVLTPIPPGALLALYSDGLVESRSLPIDQGTDRLVEALRGHSGKPVNELARDVVGDRFDQPGLGDDLTLLLARRIG